MFRGIVPFLKCFEYTTELLPTHRLIFLGRCMLLEISLIHSHVICTGAGKVQTADVLRSLLPYPLRQLKELRAQSVENYHYMQFFEIWDALKAIPTVQAKEPQIATKSMKAAWVSELKVSYDILSAYFNMLIVSCLQIAVDRAYDRIVELLTSDWLQVDEELIGAST